MFPLFLHPKQVAIKLLNALLSREDWAKQKVSLHAGKTVRLNITSKQLVMSILADGSVEQASDDMPANVTLTLDNEALSALPNAIREKASMDTLASLMHIEGDAGLASLVAELAQNLRWDVEAELTQLVGPFAANLFISTFKKLRDTSKTVGEKGLEKTKAFLSQDYHVIVQAPVVDELKEDIQRLHQQMTKLEQRIQQLKKA